MFDLVVTTDLTGFDATVYFIPIILVLIGIIAIVTKIGLFEGVTGIACILFGAIIAQTPYVIINTSYLSNGTLLVARTDFFMHPYLEIIYIIFGIFLIISASYHYSNT